MLPQTSHVRRLTPLVVLLVALLTAACTSDEPTAQADTRDAQELYDAAFDEHPADLSVINVPEDARRPSLTATYPSDDVPAITTEIHDALVESGWSVVTNTADDDRGNIVAERGEDDVQVNVTRGEGLSSVGFVFAAPGEGL